MAYVSPNYKSKAALKRAMAEGDIPRVWQPGGIGRVPRDGTVYLEGPHYPAAHTWYAEGKMVDGKLVRVK
jgi:hypothetical protein